MSNILCRTFAKSALGLPPSALVAVLLLYIYFLEYNNSLTSFLFHFKSSVGKLNFGEKYFKQSYCQYY